MFKRIASLMLCLLLVLSTAACSQESTGNDGGSALSDGDQATDSAGGEVEEINFVYMTGNNMPESDILQTIEDEINNYTIPNINTSVDLVLYSNSDYQTQLNLMLASGEQADLFKAQSAPTINFVRDDIAFDITPYLDTHLKETSEILYDDFLKLATVDGKVYGINAMGSNYFPTGWAYRSDIVEELGIDLTEVEDLFDLTEVFAQVKEAYPDMILIDNTRADVIFNGYLTNMSHIDSLSDGIGTPVGGVVKEGEDTVQNLYEMEEFKTVANLTREWYTSGFFASDAATTTATAAELLMSGNCFSIFVNLGNPQIASQYTNNYGYSFENIQVTDHWLVNGNNGTWMINANSEAPEAAAKFLNLLYTDEYIDNLLIYGIEGRDYVFDSEGYVVAPEGYTDLNSVSYTNNMNYYFWGNKWISYLVKGGLDPVANEEAMTRNYEEPIVSPYYGFLFDYSTVEAEYTAVKNVIEEYKKALWVGSLDVDTALEEMNEKLYSSGLQTVMDEKQAQLDEWLSFQE